MFWSSPTAGIGRAIGGAAAAARPSSGDYILGPRPRRAAGVRYRTQLRRYGGAGYGAGLIAVRDAEVQDINFAAAAPSLAWYRPPKSGPPTSSSCARAAAGASRCGAATTTASSTCVLRSRLPRRAPGCGLLRRPRSRAHGVGATGYTFVPSRAFRHDADPRPACGAACEEFGVLAARN